MWDCCDPQLCWFVIIARNYVRSNQVLLAKGCVCLHNYILATKVCQAQIYEFYNNLKTWFVSNTFQNLKDVMSCKHATISLTWIAFELDMNIVGVKLLAFQCGDKQYHATHPKPITCKPCKFFQYHCGQYQTYVHRYYINNLHIFFISCMNK